MINKIKCWSFRMSALSPRELALSLRLSKHQKKLNITVFVQEIMSHFLKIIHSPCREWVYGGSILFSIYVQVHVKKGPHQQKLL